jgi:cytochrome P450
LCCALRPSDHASGDIFYFKAAGRNVVVLNSPQAVHDLFDKRSAIYSERPFLTFAGTILGFDGGTALLQHNERHKRIRKYLSQTMGPGVVKRYWGLQQYETARFLQRLVNKPDMLVAQIRL